MTPASAETKKADSFAASEKTDMKFAGFDKKIAKDHGYDIRTDDRGVQYSILADTPYGSMDGALYIPGQEPTSVPAGSITPMNTVAGNCGIATLTGAGKSFYTAYAITVPNIGRAVSHTWRVAVSSSQGYNIYNLDGLPPVFGNWSTSRSISFRGWPYSGVVSNGTVTTSYGFICSSMNPSDSWYGE